jgi:hypothetical protein
MPCLAGFNAADIVKVFAPDGIEDFELYYKFSDEPVNY